MMQTGARRLRSDRGKAEADLARRAKAVMVEMEVENMVIGAFS